MVFTERLLAGALFARSIKVFNGSQGPKNPGAQFSKKKKRHTFEIHRTSETSMDSVALANRAYGLYRISTSTAVFGRSIKVLG